jgi:hypothetical protein
MPLGQFLRPLPDLAVAPFADDQAEGLQDATQQIVDLHTHLNQLVTSDQQRLSLMRRQALELHRSEPADTNHLSQPAGVAGIGFVGSCRQDRLRMPRIETDEREALGQQRTGEPY